MIKIKLKLLSVALFLGCFISTQCQNFEAFIQEELRPQSPGGTVLVAKDGEIIYHQSYGQANLELAVTMTNDHVYRIASLSKQFTAIAILKLAEQGKLALTDSITQYLKDYPTQGHTITIEQLLSHTSGIKDYLSIEAFTPAFRRNDMSPQELIDFFKQEPMDFEPGTQYRYSSSGYIILGYIIELVSGQSYEEFLQEIIFSPAELHSTRYDVTSDFIKDRVSGYRRADTTYKNTDYLSMTLPYAAGSLVSTTGDLFRWNQALLAQKIVTAKTLAKAYRPFVLKSGARSLHGYGWEIGNVQGVKCVKHSGGINGFITYAIAIPEEDIYVAILTNCENVRSLDRIAIELAAMAMGTPYTFTEISLPQSEMEALNGIYENARGQRKIVRLEDNRLLLFDRGKTKYQLVPFGQEQYFIKNSLTTWSVIREKGDIYLVENNTNQIVRWKRVDPEVKSIFPQTIKPEELKKYTGRYELGPDFYFTVSLRGNTLIGQIRDDKKELLPIGNHEFIARDIDAKLTFNLDQQQVISMTLDQGSIMTAKKID